LGRYRTALIAGAAAALAVLGGGCSKQAAPPVEIVEAPLTLGANWHELERGEKGNFRWVTNDAALVPDAGTASSNFLTIEAEPGPGLDSQPMDLQVLGAGGELLGTGKFLGRDKVTIRLWPELAQGGQASLHVEGGGKTTPGDTRVLNFRVFSAKLSRRAPENSNLPPDITRGEDPIKLAGGWYGYETFEGKSFRWVNQDAEFVVPKSGGLSRKVRFDVEPGPGLDSKPFELRVFDQAGKQVASGKVLQRTKVDLVLPAVEGTSDITYKLRSDRGGKPAPNDPRTLNFRVFAIEVGGS
jgi:hypothetical protein